MTEYRNGYPKEMGDILDFGNYVFSQAHRPHDFRQLIPKVYGEGHEDSAYFHFLALEEGKIRGMIAAYPHEYYVGGETLKTRFIGTVSVHPYARGSGYMKQLMANIDETCRADEVDFAVLGGQRQRYRYFGFEAGFLTLDFFITKANLKHSPGGEDGSVVLMPVEEDDTDLIDRMYGFYLSGPVTGRSREEFYEVIRTWNGRIYAVFNNTDCSGYLVSSGDGERIMEMRLADPDLLVPALKAYQMWHHDSYGVHLTVRAFETAFIDRLKGMAEDSVITENLQYHIYHWPKVLKAFLTLRNAHEPLKDGCLILEIDGECLKIEVRDGKVSVRTTEEPADLSLTYVQAVRQLTSPEAYYRADPKIKETGWFPLTFGMSPLDEF